MNLGAVTQQRVTSISDQGLMHSAAPFFGTSLRLSAREEVAYGSPVRLSGHSAPGDYRVLCDGGKVGKLLRYKTIADRVEIRVEGDCNHHSMSPHTRRNQKPGGRFPSFPADKDTSVETFPEHETRPPAGVIIVAASRRSRPRVPSSAPNPPLTRRPRPGERGLPSSPEDIMPEPRVPERDMRGYGGHERRGDSVIYPPTGEVMGELVTPSTEFLAALKVEGFQIVRRANHGPLVRP